MLPLLLAVAHAEPPLPASAREAGPDRWTVKASDEAVLSEMAVQSHRLGAWFTASGGVHWIGEDDAPHSVQHTQRGRRAQLDHAATFGATALAISPGNDHVRLGCIRDNGSEITVERVPMPAGWQLVGIEDAENPLADLRISVQLPAECPPQRPPIWTQDGLVDITMMENRNGCAMMVNWRQSTRGIAPPANASDRRPCRVPTPYRIAVDGRISPEPVLVEVDRMRARLESCAAEPLSGAFDLDVAASGQIAGVALHLDTDTVTQSCIEAQLRRIVLDPIPGGVSARLEGIPLSILEL